MKLQISSRLAVYAVLELAAEPGRQLSATEIGETYGISTHHLSKVLHTLGRAGLVRSVRGAGGGYQFCGNPKRTTLIDIIGLFEPVRGDEPAGQAGYETAVGAALGIVLDEIDEIAEATLRSITISTMLKIVARQRRPEADRTAAQ
ncbi:MAG: Rrf2 family transcriptional regulator [Alphaproteobacteria bacterium]|nr:Rrf2 family transcriptional regulator [Alphaproteobacteria bacterium]